MEAPRFTVFAFGLAVLSAAGFVRAAGVEAGDTLSEVRATLGTPRGQANLGDRQMLYYDRGEIELRGGTVARVALVSDEEFAQLEARRAAEAERGRAKSAEGEALKAKQLADPGFQSAPPEYQLEYWANFIRRYPGVSCADQFALARARLARQTEETNRRQAEAARRAEIEARAAVPVMTYGYSYGYPYRWRHPDHSNGPGPFHYQFDEKPVSLIAGPVVPPVFNSGSRDADASRDVRPPGRDRGDNDGPPPSLDERGASHSHDRGHEVGRWGPRPQGRM